jgi:hypothetical protein
VIWNLPRHKVESTVLFASELSLLLLLPCYPCPLSHFAKGTLSTEAITTIFEEETHHFNLQEDMCTINNTLDKLYKEFLPSSNIQNLLSPS